MINFMKNFIIVCIFCLLIGIIGIISIGVTSGYKKQVDARDRVRSVLKETKKSVEDATVNRESKYKKDRERLVK